jgi:lysozyme
MVGLQISENGLNLIKQSEALRLDAYQDSVGVWTIGYGHISGVKENDRITEEQADAFLKADLETVEKCIANCVSVSLTQGQYDALCSFVFNLGCMALRNSTLLRKLNSGDDVGASEEFQKWSHAGGKVLAGLVTRRAKEAEMFLT